MKRLRNVEKLLVFFFTFVPLLSSEAKKLIVALRLHQVVGVWVVITCLCRHILCMLSKFVLFFLHFFSVCAKKRCGWIWGGGWKCVTRMNYLWSLKNSLCFADALRCLLYALCVFENGNGKFMYRWAVEVWKAQHYIKKKPSVAHNCECIKAQQCTLFIWAQFAWRKISKLRQRNFLTSTKFSFNKNQLKSQKRFQQGKRIR